VDRSLLWLTSSCWDMDCRQPGEEGAGGSQEDGGGQEKGLRCSSPGRRGDKHGGEDGGGCGVKAVHGYTPGRPASPNFNADSNVPAF
jgi:hypothetical protein